MIGSKRFVSLAFVAILAVSVLSFNSTALAEPLSVELPAQPLASALKEFARQTGIQVAVPGELTDGKVSNAIKGKFEPADALNRLLKGSGLVAYPVNGNTYGVRSESSASKTQNLDVKPLTDSGSTETTSRLSQASTASSASTNASPSAGTGLTEIVVTGRYEFLSVDTRGATNLPLPIEKVPQSISLVSGDFIQAADLKTLGEIAEYTPGAINVGNQAGFASLIKLRGFTPGFAVDGLNVVQSFVPDGEPEYAIYDRLEIVKGPASVVYGVSSPGGLVNYVTKSATPQSTDYLYAQLGSWNYFRVEAQAAGALDSDGRARAIGIVVRDQGDSFMNFSHHEKTTVYGGLNINYSDAVTGYLHGGYERYQRTAFDGIPTEADGSAAPLPRSFFIGLAGSELTSSIYHAEGDLTWHATTSLEFSLKANYQRADTTGTFGYSYGLAENGDIGLGGEKYAPELNQNYGIGVSSIYHFDEVGLKNSFVSLGVLYQSNHDVSDTLYPSGPAGTANVFSGEAAINQALTMLLSGPLLPFNEDVNSKNLTASAQSVLQPVDPLTLLLGVSYSKPDETSGNTFVNNGSPHDFNFAGQVSYRAGITYEFLPKTYGYLSYSESFTPQGLIAVGFTLLPPITGEQYEGGIKYRSNNGRLLLTGAMFQINEKNVGVYDTTINGTDYYKDIAVRHRGLEFQALGEISRQWQINVGYAYLDPKVTQNPDSTVVGQTEVFLPKQTASVYSTYTLDSSWLRGLSFGAGTRYAGPERTSYDGSTKNLPGYTLVDATLGYSVAKWRIQLNAHNIFDKHYFINNYQTLYYGNVVGDPANVELSVRRQF